MSDIKYNLYRRCHYCNEDGEVLKGNKEDGSPIYTTCGVCGGVKEELMGYAKSPD